MEQLKKKFFEELKERLEHTNNLILGGKLPLDEYQRKCGYREGLIESLESFDEIWKKIVNEEN